jgi:hypothetical protein
VLWRRIDMAMAMVLEVSLSWRQEMVSAAVDQSSGQCEGFAGLVDD